MTELFLTRRFRMPVALLLLLVTQLAFAGQTCRAVVLNGNRVNEMPGTQSVASIGVSSSTAGGHACCDADAPAPHTCVIAVDAATSTALVAGNSQLHSPIPAAPLLVSSYARGRSSAIVPHPTPAAGPPRPAYIVFSRFLS